MITLDQATLCADLGVTPHDAPYDLKLGLALHVSPTAIPINGLRHPPVGDTTGWYIWAGEELSDKDDFFRPVHVSHLVEEIPALEKYLALPPGWRFLVAGDYQDIWFDPSLLLV
jgi:hypothetical protein